MDEEIEGETVPKGISPEILDPEFDPPVPLKLSERELREILIRME